MGSDLANLLSGLNLSPVNTLLLVALILIIRYVIVGFERRIAAVEATSQCHTKSISWIKGHIEGEESDDDE